MAKVIDKQINDSKDPIKGIITGVVLSDKMDKTIVVAVNTLKTHPKYLKKYRSTKKYKVHDEKNEKKIGDTVKFVACRPMSGGKKFQIL
ncbi:MAG: small subunit ribosomal protein S17 [Parcubacteria group bacterium Athens0714_25]|nr:MAG: small subunit ribosomal protein S17 [Parcubacteria group bacterium Athens0714_25]